MKKFLCIAIVVFSFVQNSIAQSVAINASGATANSSSILDVQSTTKGMLIPRMSKAQKNAIASPAIGLLVYQAVPDSVGFHYYSGSQWVWLNSFGGNDWKLIGNAGTDTAINFLGTTDNMPLVFRVNNEKSGRIESDAATANTFLGNRSGIINTTGDNNTAFGFRTLSNNTIGYSNVAIGSRALEALTGSKAYNVAIGDNALQNSNGVYNIGIGYQTLKQTTGNANIAIGTLVLENNTTGLTNTGIGYYALKANTTGRSNVSISNLSLYNNLSGSYNIVIGDSAAYSSTNLSHLIAIGSKSLFANTSGTNLTAVGDSALFSNTTGYKNIALGNSALVKNTTGYQNTAIGYNTLKSNITGFANIAIGDSALSTNTTNWNIAIGRYALMETTTGDKNVGIGEGALGNNITGTNNVAIGYASQSEGISNRNNVTMGYRAGWSMSGNSNTALGGDAMGDPNANAIVNNNVAVGDSVMFNYATGANSNTAIGSKALYNNTTGRSNTAIGVKALYDNITGVNNVAVGDSAAYNNTANNSVAIGSKALFTNTTGFTNTAIGNRTLFANTTGGNNTALGYNSLDENITGSDNVAIGKSTLGNMNGSDNVALGNSAGANYSLDPIDNTSSNNVYIGNAAGFNTAGSNNVFIGNNVANHLTTSNKLYIDNSNTTSPLIFGDFATNLLRVNGTLNINNDYSFPTADGLTNQVLRTNGVGAVSWATLTGENTTANNGLTLTGSNVALGGTLLNNTSITHGNFNVQHFLSGTGDFLITTPSNNVLSVLSTGNTGINTNTPTHRLHLVNTVSGSSSNYTNGMFIQNNNVTAGQATLAFKNAILPGNRAWITGMNSFDNYVIAYGDSLSSTNVVLRVDTAGYIGINPAGFPTSRLDVVGSFGNAIRVVSTNQTLGDDDHTVIVATGTGAITITLPAASTCERREYIIVNRTGGIKTISPAYNDFSGTGTDAPANASITLQSNGSNWFRIR
jgi:hypothetical protein